MQLQAAYSTLPFPLSWIISRRQRNQVLHQLQSKPETAAVIYEQAVEALGALSDRLRASAGPYFFGARPSSLDALVFAHLAFYRQSPVAAPALKAKVVEQQVLSEYVTGILNTSFAIDAQPAGKIPGADGASTSGNGWSDGAQGGGAGGSAAHEPSEDERRQWKYSKLWLMGAAASIALYVILGGKYVELVQYVAEDEDEGGEDDDAGDK